MNSGKSLKNLIAVVCIIQCLMNPVSSIKCVVCFTNEDGLCIIPSRQRNYEVDCSVYMDEYLNTIRNITTAELRATIENQLGGPFPIEYACVSSKGTLGGQAVITRDCIPRTWNCDIVKTTYNLMGFKAQSCDICYYDFCNYPNNPGNIPYNNLSYILIYLAIIYYAVY